MENRDRDKLIKKDASTESGEKSDSESIFGQNTGRSEEWDSEPSRRSGGDSNLGEQSDVNKGRSGSRSSSGMTEH